MSAPTHHDLFVGGPPMRLQARLGLVKPGELRVSRRSIIFILVTWLPLCLLAGVEGTLVPRGDGIALIADMGIYGRLWLAGPLLLAADLVAGQGLSRISGRFFDLFELSSPDQQKFVRILESTRRIRDSVLAEISCVAISWALAATIVRFVPLADFPLWHRSPGNPAALSMAGWWYAWVSLPLLLMLLGGWFWRLVAWTRFLALTARLDLPLVPVHPDRSAGVGFVGHSLRDFCWVGAALGAIVAGSVANHVLYRGASVTDFRYLIAGTAAVSVVLFTLPLLAFSTSLFAAWRRGVRSYGQLATAFGKQFEVEWFESRRPLHREVLERPDFSAATDLYQVVDRVQDFRLLPVDLVSVLMLAGATLLPFVPVVIASVPLDDLVAALAGMLR